MITSYKIKDIINTIITLTDFTYYLDNDLDFSFIDESIYNHIIDELEKELALRGIDINIDIPFTSVNNIDDLVNRIFLLTHNYCCFY